MYPRGTLYREVAIIEELYWQHEEGEASLAHYDVIRLPWHVRARSFRSLVHAYLLTRVKERICAGRF
jgi:hypothetical protein